MSEIEALIDKAEREATGWGIGPSLIVQQLIAALREAQKTIITLNKLHETDVAIRGMQAVELVRLREALKQMVDVFASKDPRRTIHGKYWGCTAKQAEETFERARAALDHHTNISRG